MLFLNLMLTGCVVPDENPVDTQPYFEYAESHYTYNGLYTWYFSAIVNDPDGRNDVNDVWVELYSGYDDHHHLITFDLNKEADSECWFFTTDEVFTTLDRVTAIFNADDGFELADSVTVDIDR